MIHGFHWECVTEDVEDFFEYEFDKILKNSVLIDEIHEFGYNTQIFLYPPHDYPIKILAIVINNQLYNAYPLINYGITHEIIIDNIIAQENMLEGQIECRLKSNPDFLFSFFDPMFYKNKSKYKITHTYSFTFSAFMYSCYPNNFKKIDLVNSKKKSGIFNIFNPKEEQTKNNLYLNKNSVMFLPYHDGDIDDYKVISPLSNIEKFVDIYGQDIYKFEITLLNDDENPFNIPAIVCKKNLKENFIPSKGESINGSIWLCGVLDNAPIEEKTYRINDCIDKIVTSKISEINQLHLKLLRNDNILDKCFYHIIVLDEPFNFSWDNGNWIAREIVEEKSIFTLDCLIFEQVFENILCKFEHYDSYGITDFYEENAIKLINLLIEEKTYIQNLSQNEFEKKYEWIFDLIRSEDFNLKYENSKEFELVFYDINILLETVIGNLKRIIKENRCLTFIGI